MKAFSTYLLLTLSVIQLTCFLLYFPFSFNYSIDETDQYYIILLGMILFLLQAGLILFSGTGGYLKTPMVYAICCCLLLVLLLSKEYGFTNQDFTVYVSVIITTLPLSLYASRSLFKLIWGAVIACWLAEFLQGLKQCISGQPIMGTLRNSGIYSCYLVVQVPLLYYYYTSCIKNKIKRPLQYGIISFLLIPLLLLICMNRSRSAIYAFLIVNLFYFRHALSNPVSRYLHSGKKAKRIGITVGFVLILSAIGLCWYLFQLKRASADGRLLIWEVALAHFREYCWTGTGFGQAALHYPVWQAGYFAGHPLPPKAFFLSADDTFIFYNDVLQLLVEIGLLPFIVLGILITLFCTGLVRKRAGNKALTAILLGIMVCSFTSYPLHVPYLLFITLFAFISLAAPTSADGAPLPVSTGIRSSASANIPALLTFCITLGVSIPVLSSVFQKARAIRAITEANPAADRVAVLRQQYPVLNKDGKYLVQLGAALVDNNDLEEGIFYLKEGRKRFVGYQSVFLLANAYERSNKIDESISEFQFLSDYVPSRFAPKYELFDLYLIKNDTASAIKMAQVILDMPVKIGSFKVDELKSDVLMKYHAIKQ